MGREFVQVSTFATLEVHYQLHETMKDNILPSLIFTLNFKNILKKKNRSTNSLQCHSRKFTSISSSLSSSSLSLSLLLSSSESSPSSSSETSCHSDSDAWVHKEIREYKYYGKFQKCCIKTHECISDIAFISNPHTGPDK